MLPQVSAPQVLPQYGYGHGQAGVYAPSCGWGAGGTPLTLTANTAWLSRFVVSEPLPMTLLAWALNTAAGSNDAYDVGLYDGGTLTRLVSLGATSGVLNSATGLRTPSVSWLCVPGLVYYAALSCGTIGTTAAVVRGLGLGAAVAAGMFGTSAPQAEALTAAASHPLPSTITGATTTATVPLFAIRKS
jgi:hypothetical protein